MKNFKTKVALILALTVAGVVSIWGFGLKKGIDLAGGTILVYETAAKEASKSYKMDELISVLRKRINPEGVQDVTIRPVGLNRVEIILPEATEEKVDQIKRQLTDTGSLEFRILANEKHDSSAIRRAKAPGGLDNPPKGYAWTLLGETVYGGPAKLGAKKRELIDFKQEWRRSFYSGAKVYLKGRDLSGAERDAAAEVDSNTENTLHFLAPVPLESVSSYRIEFNPSGIAEGPNAIVRDGPRIGNSVKHYILYKTPTPRTEVNGDLLSFVEPRHDEQFKPVVGFNFGREGAKRFGRLTREHQPEADGFKYALAIILDGVIRSAPVINAEIRESGIIEMGGSGPAVARDVNHLVEILRSGSLPTTMNPIPLQEEKIGPTLGEDTIRKGITSIVISMLVVPIFMIVYYRFAGIVAVAALILNTLLLLGSMAALQASFTLPGLAGFALTIGMAVDANVLIFERMREEAERGAGVSQQIRNGFNRAWTTILDSHLTIFLSGLVLYRVGSEEVKGFALTLIIGMVWNLFTAVYVSRVVFDYWYSRGMLKKITMLKMLDKTNIDFIGPRYICMGLSLLVIAAGLGMTAIKGRRLLNIDFTGGTLVTIRLDENAPEIKNLSEPARVSFVRERAGVLPNAAIESLNVGGQAVGTRFNIRTTESDQKKVAAAIQKSFGKTLAKIQPTFGEPTAIAKPAEPAPDSKTSKKDEASSAVVSNERFAGGRAYEIRFDGPMTADKIRPLLNRALADQKIERPEPHYELSRVRTDPTAPKTDDSRTAFILKTDLDDAQVRAALADYKRLVLNDPNPQFENIINFGATVAGETRNAALVAVVASWLIIIGYLWFRFKSVTYGLAAVIALVHDVLITLGAVALSPYKIDLPMIAAFLTLIGFSVNDTIVIFDRIRELKGKTPYLTDSLINSAINQTLSRTILTSFTAWLVVFIMLCFGGESLAGFSFALVVGFISGTYSTVYIATPILIDWVGHRPSPGGKKPAELITTNA